MTKPSREMSPTHPHHWPCPGPGLQTKATTSPGKGISCSHIPAASFGDSVSSACTGTAQPPGTQPYQTRSALPPALPDRSASFQITQNKPQRRLRRRSRGKDGSELPDSALGSAPGCLLFSQRRETESRSASPQPALTPVQSPGCWGACRRSPYPKHGSGSHCAHSTLSPGSAALNLPKRGRWETPLLAELPSERSSCIRCFRSIRSPLICPRALGLLHPQVQLSRAVGNLSFGNAALTVMQLGRHSSSEVVFKGERWINEPGLGIDP